MIANPTRTHSRRSVLLTILVATPVCLAAYFIGSSLGELPAKHNSPVADSPVAPAGLFIDPRELNLGEVWESPDFTATVRLQNTSDQDIAVSKFSTSCNCSGVEPPSPVVPANGSVLLRVNINLTYPLPYAWGVEKRPFSLAIAPILAGGKATRGWETTATIKSRVSLSALRLEFADKCTHGGLVVRRKVEATAYVPLAGLEATAHPNLASVQVKPLPGSPGKYEITIGPDPKLPLGPFEFDVPIIAVTPDGVRYRCATIRVRGDMQPATRIVPGIVFLGEQLIGSEATAEVSVRLPKGSGWAVDRIVTESRPLKLTPNGSFADGTLRYRLSQKIAERGDRESKATFIIRKGDDGWETVDLQVRYHGLPASTPNKE